MAHPWKVLRYYRLGHCLRLLPFPYPSPQAPTNECQSLFTWLAIVFFFLTAYISSLRNFKFITFVVIAVNGLMVLFWLAAMGATAHLRTTFKYSVNIYGCYDDGSDVDSTTCVVYKRQLEKRAAVATKAGLSAMSAIAGLSALEM